MKDTGSADPHIWMIRTSDNVLSGPYTQAQLIQLVEEEKLELTDEICRGNSYWIYLHEEQEVKKHLGIEVPAALVEPEEPTQTETDSIIARRMEPAHLDNPAQAAQQTSSTMGARAQRSPTVSPPAEPEIKSEMREGAVKTEYTPVVEPDDVPESSTSESNDDDIPELAVSAESIEDHTAVLNNRAFREFRPREAAHPAAAAAVTTSGPLTDAVPQSMVSSTTVSPSAIPEVNGVTVNPGSSSIVFDEEREARKRFWILTGIVLGVGAIVIYFAWKHLHS